MILGNNINIGYPWIFIFKGVKAQTKKLFDRKEDIVALRIVTMPDDIKVNSPNFNQEISKDIKVKKRWLRGLGERRCKTSRWEKSVGKVSGKSR